VRSGSALRRWNADQQVHLGTECSHKSSYRHTHLFGVRTVKQQHAPELQREVCEPIQPFSIMFSIM
jgi:hypothetical protein